MSARETEIQMRESMNTSRLQRSALWVLSLTSLLTVSCQSNSGISAGPASFENSQKGRTLSEQFEPPTNLPTNGPALPPAAPHTQGGATAVRGSNPAPTAEARAGETPKVPDELALYFDLMIRLEPLPTLDSPSQIAAAGMVTQMLSVYENNNGQWLVKQSWPVRVELKSALRSGIYQIDVNRTRGYRLTGDHLPDHSNQFEGEIALAYESSRHKNQASIVAANGDEAIAHDSDPGRAQIYLDRAHAEELYQLINQKYRGNVPVFAKAHVNLDESHTSRTGELLRNERGDFTMVAGYRVLVVITDGVSSLVKPEASATLESTYDSDDD